MRSMSKPTGMRVIVVVIVNTAITAPMTVDEAPKVIK